MDSDPVATPVDDEVTWEGPVVHTPHVIVTLYKRSIQPLLLDESVAEWGERGREREREGEREREREKERERERKRVREGDRRERERKREREREKESEGGR